MVSLAILLPHLKTPINDEALKITIWSIQTRTCSDLNVKLILEEESIPGRTDPYKVWNEMAKSSDAEYIFFGNSDMPFATGWDQVIYDEIEKFKPKNDGLDMRFIMGWLVEPGAIGVHPKNIHHEVGFCPRCFRREQFELFALDKKREHPDRINEMAFTIPSVISRRTFINFGMFNTNKGFMAAPHDLEFTDKLMGGGGIPVRIPFFCYHFQNLSRRKNRCACYQQESTRIE